MILFISTLRFFCSPNIRLAIEKIDYSNQAQPGTL